MRELSASRKKGLEIARQTFQYAASNLLYVQGRARTIRAFSFYDGDGQYPKNFLREWSTRFDNFEIDYDVAPPIINKVKAKIDNVCGVEIQNRFRTAYRTHSFNEEEELLAKGLTHLGYFIQEDTDMPIIHSHVNKDMLICGLGWSNLYLQEEQIGCDYIHPLNIIYDADDFSPLMTEQQYVCRIHWLPKQTMLMLWPKYKAEIENLFYNSHSLGVGSYSPEFFNRVMDWIDVSAIGGGDGIGSRIMVIEVQRKEKRTYYTGLTDSDENEGTGKEFQTFDEDLAHEIIGKGQKVQEKQGYQIIRTLFCNDVVFEHGPLNPNLPNGSFTYVPAVYGRRSSDGVPVGWLSSMEDIQRIINYTKAKELLMVNSTRAIVDTTAFADGQTPEEMRQELSRNDSLIIKNKDSEVTLHPNIDLATSQINTARRLDEEMQQVSGMYSDAMGAESNATASVSINSRTRNSFKTQVMGFDNLMFMKKRSAKLILDLIQGGGFENIAVPILDDKERQTLYLNLAVTKNGKKVIYNDVRNLNLGIYIEQTHDYESAPEEQRENFQAMMSNPNAMMMMQSPSVMKLMGWRNWQKIAEEMQSISQQKAQSEQMAAGGGGGGALPQGPGGGSPQDMGMMQQNPMGAMG